MRGYLLRRLLLLPLTLFAIVLINFIILNLAPGDPVTVGDLSPGGEASRRAETQSSFADNQYLLFREHYGLTLPVLFNSWPAIQREKMQRALFSLATRKASKEAMEEMPASLYGSLLTAWGDRARYIMRPLLQEALNTRESPAYRRFAANLFIRGGTRQGAIGAKLTETQKVENKKIAEDNAYLATLKVSSQDTVERIDEKTALLKQWMEKNIALFPRYTPSQRANIFFFETRFSRYLKRLATLDFGTLRSDSNKSVIVEVGKRLKYSMTLALLPMALGFALSLLFGAIMALKHNKWPDLTLNSLFLILFAIPVFVVAPFLIEKIALTFTSLHLPLGGFHSSEEHFATFTSKEKLSDIARHLILPLIALIYGTLAIQSRLSRTAFLEVMRQPFVTAAQARGLPFRLILIKHIGRNAAITLVTALATSLSVILSGSLIVETVFEINGFGRFFYDAIVSRDYNVMLFSTFATSLLTLLGYLLADLCYTLLDPRVSLE